MQILRYTQLLNNKCAHVHANILPNTRPWTDSQRNPRRQDYGFLNCTRIRQHMITWFNPAGEKGRNFLPSVIMEPTCVDLRISPNAPSLSFFLLTSGKASNSARSWWGCMIPFPWPSILQTPKFPYSPSSQDYKTVNRKKKRKALQSD